jgi:hypothetical protein
LHLYNLIRKLCARGAGGIPAALPASKYRPWFESRSCSRRKRSSSWHTAAARDLESGGFWRRITNLYAVQFQPLFIFESNLFTINNPKSNGSAFKCLHRLWTSARSGLLTMETNIHRNTVSDARSGRSVDTLRPREAFSEVAVRSRSCTEELMKR